MTLLPAFDTDTYPGDQAMHLYRKDFGACGFYLAPAPSHRDTSWMGARSVLTVLGYVILPIYVGQETAGPGDHEASTARGAIDAADCVSLLGQAGFPLGSAVFLDLEDGGLLTNEANYAAAWAKAVATSGYRAGVYCSHVIADRVAFVAPAALLWCFRVPTTEETDAEPPYATPALAGCGYPRAVAWQYRQNVRLPDDRLVDLDVVDAGMVGVVTGA